MKITNADKCTGCGLCASLCPQQCIEIKYNNDGFLTPTIDANKCIHCNKCVKNCPANNEYINSNEIPTLYVAAHKCKQVKYNSTSGGAYFAIAKLFLENNGIVIASSMNGIEPPTHIVITQIDEIKKTQKSKYIQSNIFSVYKEILQYNNSNRPILFIGTPCQVYAIKRYVIIKKLNIKILYIDLICHGVGSQKLFNSHIKNIETKYKSKVVSYDFRFANNKTNFNELVLFENGKKIIRDSFHSDYLTLYMRKYIYRISCYGCRYSTLPRVGDISLGDYIGDKQMLPLKKEDRCSSIFINNEKGQRIIDKIKGQFILENAPLENAIKTNWNVSKATITPPNREFINFNENINIVRKHYVKDSIKSYLISIIGDKVIKKIKDKF